ncbi:PP2C family protein-serine/threonine phosphatase [Humitalea sp. 24SJ18S-53]|uniref:PP2C family protein-serine/threonine phosphatase n=1 Tax=Humitalea sp. 24SJ18S-53 TaxID=3422307 RepID=UPI003D6648A6
MSTFALLVVDDSAFNRLMLTRRLAELGYTDVTLANDGIEGLAAIAARHFDCVLLDLEMPQMDGIAVLERLREHQGTAPPVIVISALTEMDTIVRCIALGAEDYLPKTFDLPLLRARLGAVLEKKHLRDLADGRRHVIEAELESARAAQLALMRRDFAAIAQPGLTIAAAMIPAREVGGDLYDAMRLPCGGVLLCVADVSGKGAPAGLTMARTLGAIRAAARLVPGPLPDPATILAYANADLAAENDSQTFVTALLIVLDAATGDGRICVAGHEAPYLLDEHEARPLTGFARQPPLGAWEGFAYASTAIHVAAGQGLFLYSDGVTEAENAAQDFFGRDRLRATLAPLRGASPDAVVAAVLAAIVTFADGAPQNDDITVLAFRRG